MKRFCRPAIGRVGRATRLGRAGMLGFFVLFCIFVVVTGIVSHGSACSCEETCGGIDNLTTVYDCVVVTYEGVPCHCEGMELIVRGDAIQTGHICCKGGVAYGKACMPVYQSFTWLGKYRECYGEPEGCSVTMCNKSEWKYSGSGTVIIGYYCDPNKL